METPVNGYRNMSEQDLVNTHPPARTVEVLPPVDGDGWMDVPFIVVGWAPDPDEGAGIIACYTQDEVARAVLANTDAGCSKVCVVRPSISPAPLAGLVKVPESAN